MLAIDTAAETFALAHPSRIWQVITYAGSAWVVVPLTLLLLLVFKRPKDRLFLASATFTALVLGRLLKLLFAVTRPAEATLFSYSFPSGHTLQSTALYGALAMLLWKNYRWQALLLLTIPLLVGISRIMLVEHWLTDVLAAWCIGALSLVLLRITFQASSSGRR